MLKPGKYRAKPTCWGLSETKAGREQYQIEFRITSPAVDDADRVINWWGSLSTDKSEEITVQALKNCGATGEDIRSLELDRDVEVELVVELDERGSLKVRWVNDPAAAGGIRYPLAEDRAAALADRMRGTLGAALGGKKPAGKPAPRPAAEPAQASAPAQGDTRPDDDIPF